MALFASSGMIAPIDDGSVGGARSTCRTRWRSPERTLAIAETTGSSCGGRDLPLGRIVQRAAYRDGVEARHAGGDREIEWRRGLLEIFALTLEPSLERGHIPAPGAGGPR